MAFRISFYTVGDIHFASSRDRVLQYLPFLHADGIVTTVMTDNILYEKHSFLRPLERRWHRFAQRLLFLCSAPFHDIVFIQKTVFPRWFINLLTFLNPRLVFDLDDAIYTTSKVERIDTSNLDYLLSKTKIVCTENEENAEYVRRHNPRVVSILGPIDCQRYRPRGSRPRSGPVTIGWVGAPTNERYLLLIRDALAALDPASYRFLSIGVRPDFAERWGLPIDVRQWTLDTEVALLEELDIGVMPMPDDRWSRGKGGYKLLQYMAMGLPSVTHPIGVNTELVEDGATGFLATSTEEWISAFRRLMASEELRQTLGAEARKRAVERYSCEHSYPIFKALLEECLENGR